MAHTYGRLTDIECTFRTLKSELGLRPIYHRNDTRIAGHLFISVLVYYAVHLICTQLKMRGIHESWSALQFVLNNWQRITTVLPQDKERCLRLTLDADLTPYQRHIASIMGINPTGFVHKTKEKRPKKGMRPVNR